MGQAGCAAWLHSAGAQAAAGINKELTAEWGEVSLMEAAWGCRGSTELGVLSPQPGAVVGTQDLGLRAAQAVWPFIFLNLGCLSCDMGMVTTPTSWGWRAKIVAFLWAPCLLARGGNASDLEGKVGGVSCLPGFLPPSLRAQFLPRPLSPGASTWKEDLRAGQTDPSSQGSHFASRKRKRGTR